VSGEVVITGAGAVTPAAPAGALDDALAALPAAIRTRATRAERVTQLALVAAWRALADSGLALSDAEPSPDLGIVLGTGFGCFLTNAAFQEKLAAEGMPGASPRLFAATVSNAAAGEVSIALGLAGPGITLTAGCASGTLALGEAAALAAGGDVELVLAGGVDAVGPALTAFIAAGGLGVGGPVDEGAALVVLEPLAAARGRGARIRGVVLGHGAGFEPDPTADDAGDGFVHAARAALAGAGTTVATVAVAAPPITRAFVERAMTRVLGDGPVRRLAFDGALGHSLGAAGPRTVVRLLETEAPGTTVLIADACASGHVAALVVRVGDAT
jgi:3-oxoacyl-(acyl-carrier-protein) synthase